MQPKNLLVLMADEHQAAITGCYGNPCVETPNLDALAARGTRFTNAYTNSPICVPARAIFATGRYAHQTSHWDNAFPYYGEPESWGHRLQAAGISVESIGKLHYRRQEDSSGFDVEHDAMYVAEGIGEIVSCLRGRAPHRQGRGGIVKAGPGDSSYLNYDRRITTQARDWLHAHAADETPWVLFVSFVCPHPPFIAPPELFAHYAQMDLPFPHQWQQPEWPTHPALNFFRTHFGWEAPVDEASIQRMLATYYALCTFVDQNVGKVLNTLSDLGLAEATRVLYTSDHGAMLGARGLFGKFTMYEEAARIPMIVAGPDVPANKTVDTPVSLVDGYPTILSALDVNDDANTPPRPGQSLWQLAQGPTQERTIFSEYHAAGTRNAIFMLCDGAYKYIHYVHEAPQLFDLANDPGELVNQAENPAYTAVRADFEERLRDLLDPEAIDAQAKAEQLAKVADFGGEAAVLARGLSNSPIPGEAPVFQRNLSN
ncbi:MAG TPA: sulfatase-like hydrolase/transferase [Caldilineaceae bacterium]|nr:sulfatase-like hydrolase/transferase [Caldilineaceae bacterium]